MGSPAPVRRMHGWLAGPRPGRSFNFSRRGLYAGSNALHSEESRDFGLRADGIFGADVDVLLLQSSLTWRPSW